MRDETVSRINKILVWAAIIFGVLTIAAQAWHLHRLYGGQ